MSVVWSDLAHPFLKTMCFEREKLMVRPQIEPAATAKIGKIADEPSE
jgi:hypothetical protein